jgi:hypothetical protein
MIIDKEEPSFAEKVKSKLLEVLAEAANLEKKVDIYQQLIMILLSTLRSCEDEKAHRSYLLTVKRLKTKSDYNFLKGWVD